MDSFGTERDREGRPSFLTDVILDDSPAATPALAAETEARLEAALWQLSPVYREAICLRAYCGMSDARMAAAMDLPSAETASVLFLRARAELRNRL